MKNKARHIAAALSSRFSMETLIKLTGQKQILPFYHTVSANPEPHFSQLTYFRSHNDFIDDLNFFTKHFKSVPAHQINAKDRLFHLSFDDGMQEMYTVVCPLLKDRGLHAAFFVNTDFLDNKKMFVSHKRSLLLHELGQSDFHTTQLSEFLNVDKTVVNNRVSAIRDEAKVDEIAAKIQIDFAEYLHEKRPYLTTKQVIELKNAGFAIGNHGRSHRNFNTLDFAQQKAEVEDVNLFLNEIGTEQCLFAFPYGDHQIKNEFFKWMYSEGGIDLSFGISGLKHDSFAKHHHRILMEEPGYSAEEIIKAEYFYYFWKSLLYRNRIRR